MNQNHGQDGNPQGDPRGQQGRNPHPHQGQHGAGGDWQQPPHQGQPRQPRQGGRGRGKNRSAVRPGEVAAARADLEERLGFLRRTYTWLCGAVFMCVAMMVMFWHSPAFEPVITFMASTSWLLVLALFIGFSWMGDMMAHRVDSKALQFIGLSVVVGAYAIIFSYLFVASGVFVEGHGVDGSVLFHALLLTLATFSILTSIVFITKKDFSILRTGLIVMTALALGAIVAGALFGFTLGLGFAVAMVGFCSALIIYQTSNILHHYPTNRHMGAAVALFSSVGMLFWYLFMILGLDG